jgi:hypothetical protein
MARPVPAPAKQLSHPPSRLPWVDLERSVTPRQRFLDGKSTFWDAIELQLFRSLVRSGLRGAQIVSNQFTAISMT